MINELEEDMKSDIEKAYALLELQRKIVGIKIVYSQEEFLSVKAKELLHPLSYCVAVKCAADGHSLKFTKATSGCIGSTRALGLTPLDRDYLDGTEGWQLGLYPSKEAAAHIAGEFANCPDNAFGVIVKPLEAFEQDPDVVIIISDSREMMRIIQGYTYTYGINTGFALSGNQAVCVECTAYPIKNQKLNLSVFCAGTRYKARWKDDEMAAGLPYSQFSGLVAGIYATVDPVERKDRKLKIAQKLSPKHHTDFDYSKTYYMKEQ